MPSALRPAQICRNVRPSSTSAKMRCTTGAAIGSGSNRFSFTYHHDVDALIPRLVAVRGFANADDIAAVLHARLTGATSRARQFKTDSCCPRPDRRPRAGRGRGYDAGYATSPRRTPAAD